MTTQARMVDDFKNLSGAMTALESYRQILTSGHVLTKQAAAVMHMDLQQIGKEWNLDETVALESFPAKPSPSEPSRSQSSTLANVTVKIVQVAERLREMLLELFDKAKEEIDELLNGVGNLEAKVKSTAEAVANMPVQTGREVTVDSGMMSWLSTDGVFDDNRITALARLAKVGSTVYPQVVIDYYDDLTAAVKHYTPSGEGAERFIEAIEESTRPLEFLNKDDTLYPGNQRLVMDEDGFTCGMAQDDTAKNIEGPYSMPIRAKSILGQELVKIQTVIEELGKARDAEETMNATVKRLGEALVALSKKAEASKNPTVIADTTKVINNVLVMTRQTKPNNKSIIKYVGRQLQANLLLMQLEARTAILKVSA